MTTAELNKSLTLWKRRYTARLKLLSAARQDLLEARTSGVHPRQALVDRVTQREEQVAEALKNIKLREDQLAEKSKGKVSRPIERISKNVVNQSVRNGVPKVIVLHSTESSNRPGVSDLESVLSWFNNPAAQASSHVIVDSEGFSAKAVDDARKAWTQASFNDIGLSIEQVGFAAQGQGEWTDAQLLKTAQYIAYWSKKYNIPITKSTTNGVATHEMLGPAGGNHHDPGKNYPFDRVLTLARDLAKNGW